jgi:hypothetical protein
MCGIAGHFGRPVGPWVRERMLAALANRGWHISPPSTWQRRLADDALAAVGLVHTRLSIIDPQPTPTSDGADDGTLDPTTARSTDGATMQQLTDDVRFQPRRHRVHPARL